MAPGWRRLTRLGWLLAAVLAAATDTPAQTATGSGTATFVVPSGFAKLEIGRATIAFADYSPDALAQIPADFGIDIVTKTQSSGTTVLTVQALDDFKYGTVSIPATALSWTISGGTGYSGGTMSMSQAVSLGAWSSSGRFATTQSYLFQNSWFWPTGQFSLTVRYTLTSP